MTPTYSVCTQLSTRVIHCWKEQDKQILHVSRSTCLWTLSTLNIPTMETLLWWVDWCDVCGTFWSCHRKQSEHGRSDEKCWWLELFFVERHCQVTKLASPHLSFFFFFLSFFFGCKCKVFIFAGRFEIQWCWDNVPRYTHTHACMRAHIHTHTHTCTHTHTNTHTHTHTHFYPRDRTEN